MSQCSFCQAELEPGAEHCPICGQPHEPDELVETLPLAPGLAASDASQPGEMFLATPAKQDTREEGELPTAPQPGEMVLDAPAEQDTLELDDTPTLPGSTSEFPGDGGSASLPGGPPFWQAIPGLSQPTQSGPIAGPDAPASGPPPAAPRGPHVPFLQPLRKRLTPRVIAAVLAALVILASLGAAAYILTRPRPVIQVMSNQHVGSVPAGAPDDVLRVIGQDFSGNSAITLLLDGKSTPGAPKVTSNGQGNFTVNLTITDDWLISAHTLTARDAQGYATKDGARLEVLPQPVLAVVSNYMVGTTQAGAEGTLLLVTGKRFTPNAALTLLLDGKPLTLPTPLQSDARGKISTSLAVTADWTLGNHVLTAEDAKGYVTRSGVPLVIVAQGEANTPGPNGAPPDDANFGVSVSVQTTDTATGKIYSFQFYLDVTGQPDPAGGTVCNLQYDDGQPHTNTGRFSDGTSYTETATYSCQGSYKSGKLAYVELVTTDVFKLPGGIVCSRYRPYILDALVGTYTGSSFSGQYASPFVTIPCNDGGYIYYDAEVGTWAGSV